MARLKNEGYATAFSAHLRTLREQQGLTLEQLGRLSNLDLGTVQRIETTNGNVTISTLLALAHGLKVHPKELLSFNYKKYL